ncbi:MAG TPA: DUF3084 domain-containing protein, partial [Armatimonadota bacterium]|nr:DUF3084 domain-containing protein [Armatimonadota bacterium]
MSSREIMLFLALIIIVVSGLIAYIGDLVGRKMGRKRLTMLGLRPRHTAIIISVGMGMLIAALTLAATVTVSGTIRESFFTPISALKAKLSAMQRTVARADEEIKRTTDDANRVKQRFAEEAKKLAETDRQLQASVRQRGRIQRQLATARRELGAVQARLDAKQHDLEAARRRLLVAQGQYRQLREDMDYTSASRTRTAQELLKLQDEEMRL